MVGGAPAAVRAVSTGPGRSGQRADGSADTDSTSQQGGEPGELRVRRLFDSGALARGSRLVRQPLSAVQAWGAPQQCSGAGRLLFHQLGLVTQRGTA